MSTSETVVGPHNVPSASNTPVDCLTPVVGVAKSNYIIMEHIPFHTYITLLKSIFTWTTSFQMFL